MTLKKITEKASALALIVLQACAVNPKTTGNNITDGLPVRDSCTLERLYKDMPQEINTDSPDVWFVNALCEGRADDVAALFRETKIFRDDLPAVDAPYGRFEGLDGIKAFAEGFLPRFNAEGATFTPVFQTVGGGRICLEGVFKFVVDGAINEAPFFVCVDLRTPVLLDEVRMYTNYTYVPDLTPYRKPIWQSAHLEMGDPQLLTSGMRAYYEALHHAPYCSPDKIHECFAEQCILGGYEPKNSRVLSGEEMSKSAHSFGFGLSTYIPACVGMRYETIIDDGKTCVIEWCHVVSDLGAESRNRIAMSACSAYTRDENGYLCAVRICDYAGHEAEIDWDKAGISEKEARAINRIHEFPAGCGDKPQQNY
ncbi:MAG: nuclear transport factor 2 family protein [Bacteroidia bacterium]|nr:nuclear transport factor 2 family protein [Bacteroidia bacterium]